MSKVPSSPKVGRGRELHLLYINIIIYSNDLTFAIAFFFFTIYNTFFLVGLAFGTGSAVAHRAVDSIMGPRTIQHETVGAAAPDAATTSSVSADACVNHSKAFTDVCLLSLCMHLCLFAVILTSYASHGT